MTVWQKRLFKLKGFLIYLYSLALLRYSAFNRAQLKKFFAASTVNKLHLGCGLLYLPGWCNVLYEKNQEYGRLTKREGTDFLNYNLMGPWPWAENSVTHVAAAHFIEHIDLNQCLWFCGQAYNVLKPGGVIRLSCPDLEVYARNYVAGNQDFFSNQEIIKACTFKTALTSSQIFAAKAYDSGGAHKWFHDFSSLKSVLERAGFVDVKKVDRLEGKTPDLAKLELAGREIETVYVEAVKPRQLT